ncbi:ABC transporter ATP-binding protein [Halopelagius longus]|uniref:ABC-type D-xylose/L-arabinose transporter n=1 Tax=Halopelagius longus TaxID=1236180 RepID=A0A1H0XNA7_9EURY|nr:ABC transporter ATP-binding protein [Halopelagius longus]RDI71953.1 ABC transporter ATP-binding protein [Halopelagius longus]SDQ04395.1 multiple sugar transport system ATP-binding protein [Halopelagius longus]
MTRLELGNVTKTFDSPGGEVVAVNDLSLTVEEGEFLVLLGPSGCGKTTTLRMIGGLEEPTEGDVMFDGIRVNDVKARNRDVAMVFQDFALYPHMTVERNLGFGLEREDNDLSSAAITEKVREVAEMLEILDLLDKKPAALSGGQKQRVALGRAIVREPRLFLFDEPLANLDAKLRKTMRTEIDRLQSRMDITSAYVTHNQEEAMTIADKIAVLDDGKLQQVGTPAEVFNEPTNLFVARFVGSPDMNVFEATMTEDGDAYRIETAGTSFRIPAALVPGETAAMDVTVGFRPQDLFREGSSATRRGHGGPVIDTDVNVIEPLGTDAIVHADAEAGELTATVTRFHEIDEGESVRFTVAPEHVYLFEKETERLIKGRLDAETSDTGSAEEATV